MDNGATRRKGVSIFKYLCSREEGLITELGENTYTKQMLYCKMLSMLDNRYKTSKITWEQKREIVENICVTKSSMGEVECIKAEIPNTESEIKVIAKKEFEFKEVNLVKHILDNNGLEAKNKYIVVLTENNDILREYGEVQIRVINRETLRRLKKAVEREELVMNVLVPEMEKYIQRCVKTKTELTINERYEKIQNEFMKYLLTHPDDDPA